MVAPGEAAGIQPGQSGRALALPRSGALARTESYVREGHCELRGWGRSFPRPFMNENLRDRLARPSSRQHRRAPHARWLGSTQALAGDSADGGSRDDDRKPDGK
jgi:hypothetical protein